MPLPPEKAQNIYEDLIRQLEKISRHNRQGSYPTRKSYFGDVKIYELPPVSWTRS